MSISIEADLSKVLVYDWFILQLCLATLFLFEHAERLNLLLLPPAAPCFQHSFKLGSEILRRRPPRGLRRFLLLFYSFPFRYPSIATNILVRSRTLLYRNSDPSVNYCHPCTYILNTLTPTTKVLQNWRQVWCFKALPTCLIHALSRAISNHHSLSEANLIQQTATTTALFSAG